MKTKQQSTPMIKAIKYAIVFSLTSLISQSASAVRFDVGYMMRFATMAYVPQGTNQGIDGNSYTLNGSTGTDTYVAVTGYLGNWEVKFSTDLRTTSYKIPSNVPVPAVPNVPIIAANNKTALRFAYGKANFSPFVGIVSDSVVYVPQQTSSGVTFDLKTADINFITVGGAIIATGNRPGLEARGALEIMIPVSSPTVNGKPITATYNTEITVEVKFGAKKRFGVMGSLGFQDYKDVNEYHINHFAGGIVAGF